MKRSLVLALSFVMIVGVVAGAVYEGKPPVKEDYWENLPETWKFNFTTFGEFGASNYENANFQIAGFIETKKSLRRFYKEGGLTEDEKLRIKSTTTEGRFASRSMRIYVYSHGDSMEPFDPAKFSFSQSRGSTEYSVNPATITGFDQEGVMVGKLSVPQEIDIRETFYIHYKYGSAKAYTTGYFADSPYPKEEEMSSDTEETETNTSKEPKTSEETGPDTQDKNYDFEGKNTDYTLTWGTGKASVNVENGKLRLLADRGKTNWALHSPTPFYPTSEDVPFDLKVEGKIVEGEGALGVVFGVDKESGSFCDFLVDPQRRTYLWSCTSGSTRVREPDWETEPSIIDEGTNSLRVEMTRNKQASFYINGHTVETLDLESYKGGRVGVLVNAFEESAIAGFEYFKLKTYQY